MDECVGRECAKAQLLVDKDCRVYRVDRLGKVFEHLR